MANTRVGIVLCPNISSGGTVADFSANGRMGAVSIYNAGPDPVYFSFDAAPASAALQNGVRRLLIGEAYNVEDMTFVTVGLIIAAGKAAQVQIEAWPRAGGAGGSGALG